MDLRGTNLIGTLLERRYRVDALLARGGMSTVYQGLDTRLERPVAIKVMDPRFSGDRSFIDRFVLEARAAAQLHHPGVVGVYDQGDDGEHVFLVMELVEGATLRDLLQDQDLLSVPLALSVLEPILSALAAAHRAGLVHRDIKPENVLIGRGGAVKVADFGLVRAMASAGTTSDSMIMGTVAYLSPEQVTTGVADARSDVYAAGVVLYEMLTGVPPFTGDTPISVAYRHVNDEVPPPSALVPGLPSEVDELVLRATRRDPALRPADAAAFLLDLQRLRGTLGIRHVPVPVPVREWPEKVGANSHPSDDPPTEQFSPAVTAPHRPNQSAMASAGPRGTRAISRAELAAAAVAGEPIPDPPAAGLPPYHAERTRSRRTFLIWIGVVLLLAAIIGVAAWWLGAGRWTAVPQVNGKDQTVAEKLVHDADLTPHARPVHDNDITKGLVVKAEPGQGARILRNDNVTLLVSQGRPQVPAVTPGVEPDDADRAVRDAELQPRRDDSVNKYDDTVPSGRVLFLDPGPGTELLINAPVTVVLSKGPPPRPVPGVIGKSHDEAFDILRKAGFDPYDKEAAFSDRYEAGKVISTDPPADTRIPPGGSSRVGVVVSNAVTVPDLLGLRVDEARKALKDLKLEVQVQQFGHRENGRVIGQLPLGGSYVKPGSTVIITAFP